VTWALQSLYISDILFQEEHLLRGDPGAAAVECLQPVEIHPRSESVPTELQAMGSRREIPGIDERGDELAEHVEDLQIYPGGGGQIETDRRHGVEGVREILMERERLRGVIRGRHAERYRGDRGVPQDKRARGADVRAEHLAREGVDHVHAR